MRNSFNPEGLTWAQRRRQKNHQRALTFLSLTVFVLMAFPRLRISFGPVPLYIIDIFILLTTYFSLRLKPARPSSLRPLVIFILFSAFLSEIISGLRLGTLLEPTYIFARTLLAGSLFFSVPKIIRSKDDLVKIIKATLPGVILTALLLMMTSIPQTRGEVINNIFSLPFLEPSAESVAGRYELTLQAMRGRSLVGVSILSGAFLNTLWPLLFLLRSDTKINALWRIALLAAMVLSPVAVVMTYSRGAIMGLLFVVIAVLFFNSGKVRQSVILGIGFALAVFIWVGWESEIFYFERLTTSTQIAIESDFQDESSAQRLQGYIEPFRHVTKNPVFLFIGEGFAQRKVASDELFAWRSGAAIHSVFSASYYGYGLLAAFTYMLLLIGSYRKILRHIRFSSGKFSRSFSQALLAGLAGLTSWFLLGHAAVSQPRGAMLLFFVFGLVQVQTNFAETDREERVDNLENSVA